LGGHGSEPGHQLLPFAPVAAPTQGLQVGLLSVAALAARDDVIDFQVDGPQAVATAPAISGQYLGAKTVRYAPSWAAVLIAGPLQLAEVEEVAEGVQVYGVGGADQVLQLDRMVGEQIVHPGREQQQTDEMRLVGVGQLAEAEVVEQIVGQSDLPAGALELAEVPKGDELLHTVTGLSPSG